MRRALVVLLVSVLAGGPTAPAGAATPDMRNWNVRGRSSCSKPPDEVEILAGPVQGTRQTGVAHLSVDTSTSSKPWPAPSGWTPVVGGFTTTHADAVKGGTLTAFAQSGADDELGPVSCVVALYRGRRVLAVSTSAAMVMLVLGRRPSLVFELRGVRKGRTYELGGYLTDGANEHRSTPWREFSLKGKASRSGTGIWRWAAPGLSRFYDIEWYLPHRRSDETPVLQMSRLGAPVVAPAPPTPAPTPAPTP